MADLQTKFASGRQDWETPPDIIEPLRSEFAFTIDVAASPTNAKAPNYYTVETDALTMTWRGTCWMNPPFKEVGRWVAKAHRESQQGATVVCLLPARTNTGWFHDYCLKAEVRFLRGRPKFVGATHGLPQPLMLVIFRGVDNCRGDVAGEHRHSVMSLHTDG